MPMVADLRLRRSTAQLRHRLESSCAQLSELSQETEKRFLSFGNSLQAQVALTGRLSRQSHELSEFGKRYESADCAIRGTSALISDYLDLSEEFADEVKRLSTALADYGESLRKVLADQEQLERSFAPMRALNSLFKIEAAILSVELQSLFQAVTGDMENLHSQVIVSFASHKEMLSATLSRVQATAKELRIQSDKNHELIRLKRDEVKAAMARLEVEFATSRSRNSQLAGSVSGLNRDIDAITVSLQYQDITRQKIEHVQTAAKEIISQYAAPGATPFQQRLHVQQTLCQVQTFQLNSTQQELEKATSCIKTGLTGLLQRIHSIESECLSIEDMRAIISGMDATKAEMSEALRVSAQLMQDSQDCLARALQISNGFSSATTGATDTMRKLAADLHLMGLNAQVQSVHANNGCLEVLSGETSAMSREAGVLTLAFERKLAAMSAELSELMKTSGGFHDGTMNRLAALRARDEAVFLQLSEETETSKSLMRDVGDLLEQLKVQANDLLSSIDLADFSRAAIDDARSVFTDFIAVCESHSTGEDMNARDVLKSVSARYTMDSEREAHAAATGAVAAQATQVTAAPTAQEADIFFTDAPSDTSSTPAPAGDAPADESKVSDNVELF